MSSKLVEPAIATAMTMNLASLQDIVLNLERICNTPLPFAYQVHLRMTLWYVPAYLPMLSFRSTGAFNRLYLTFLPVSSTCFYPFLTSTKIIQFQIYLAYGVVTIPATGFAAFLLLGFLEIGQEMCVISSFPYGLLINSGLQ